MQRYPNKAWMSDAEPEKLWASVVGDTEPWRRGRLFLILLAITQFLLHLLVIGSELLAGNVERLISVMIGAIAFWLSFYFIWIGVHWVRWISGGLSCLLGFAKLIWGFRDSSGLLLLDGTIALVTGAYLALAPSVYFFALRQKEHVRWKESLVVGAVFALLLVSAGVTGFALNNYKTQLVLSAHTFANRTFRNVYVDGDARFLQAHATRRLLTEVGWDRLSRFVAQRDVALGVARELRPAKGRLRFRFLFPRTLVVEGVMISEAVTDAGPVLLIANIGQAGGEWEIDSIAWRYIERLTPP